MISRVERSYARNPSFVFEVDGSPLEKFAYRHVRHMWFAALGRVTAGDKGGRRIDPTSVALYDTVCGQWEDDGRAPPPDILGRVGADLLPDATSKMLRKRFDSAQRRRHRERFRSLIQSRAEAEVMLRRVTAEAERQEATLTRRATALDAKTQEVEATMEAQRRQLAGERAKFDQARRDWEDWNNKKTAELDRARGEAQRILAEGRAASPNLPRTSSTTKPRD